MATRTWTTEQRQRQREAIMRWKPWNQSTGPTSPEGKAVAARNAYSGGRRAALRNLIKEMNLALRKQQESLAVYSGK
jgi:hypothetical protein